MPPSGPPSRASKSSASSCGSGPIGYLGLLQAENIYDTALLALVQAQAARCADPAALLQALGGAWWNRTDAPQSKEWDIELIP